MSKLSPVMKKEYLFFFPDWGEASLEVSRGLEIMTEGFFNLLLEESIENIQLIERFLSQGRHSSLIPAQQA